MSKEIQQIELTAIPAELDDCFEIITEAGAEEFALFGGAVRDTDYAAYHHTERPIKDYDVRVWLPADNYKECERKFVTGLGRAATSPIRIVPAGGTPYVRYCFDFSGTEMDVSVRPRKTKEALIAGVAIDRARDADIGLSSVAIAPDGIAWGTAEYLEDRNNRTLSVYPNPNAERRLSYTERMARKYPDHTVILLG